jgi:CDP-paratose 2-epimerase
MKMLVTGGCGFLGSNIVADWKCDATEVHVVDTLWKAGSRRNLEWLEKEVPGRARLHFHHFDIADGRLVNGLFRKESPFDAVIHLAGQVAMTTSLEDPTGDFLTNAMGTLNLLEATRIHSPQSVFIFSSTNKVYGELKSIRFEERETRWEAPDYPCGFDESLPLDFSSPYGCSKGSADQYVRDWARVFDLRTIVFRHSSIYGGRQYSSFDQGWIGWFTAQALRQFEAGQRGEDPKPFKIAGDGKQVRDVLHADDLRSLYRKAIENANMAAGEVFNIGGGIENSRSLLELFADLERLLDRSGYFRLRYSRHDWRVSDQRAFVADGSRARLLLGWEPRVSCEDGLPSMIEWVREASRREREV